MACAPGSGPSGPSMSREAGVEVVGRVREIIGADAQVTDLLGFGAGMGTGRQNGQRHEESGNQWYSHGSRFWWKSEGGGYCGRGSATFVGGSVEVS